MKKTKNKQQPYTPQNDAEKRLVKWLKREHRAVDKRKRRKPKSWTLKKGCGFETDEVTKWLDEHADDIFFLDDYGYDLVHFKFDPDEIQADDCPPDLNLKEHGILLRHKFYEYCDPPNGSSLEVVDERAQTCAPEESDSHPVTSQTIYLLDTWLLGHGHGELIGWLSVRHAP